MSRSDVAFFTCLIAAVTLGVAIGVMLLADRPSLAVWTSLPVPVLVLGTFYSILGVSPSLLKTRTNVVLALTIGLVEAALVLLLLDVGIVGVVLAALMGVFAFLTLAIGVTRFGGA